MPDFPLPIGGADSSTQQQVPKSEFPPTRWSIVVQARQSESSQGASALNELCAAYWMPLYAFARRKGHSPEDAEDLTQGFLAQFVSKECFNRVHKEKGRLRSYLCRSMENYMRDQWRRQNAQIRKESGVVVRGLSTDQAEQILANDLGYLRESPLERFERRWALALLDRAIERLARHYGEKGESELFEQLKPFLDGSRDNEESYRQFAERLGLSANVVRVRTTRLRKRFRKYIVQEVEATTPKLEVEDELRFLFSVFQRRPAA